MADDILQSIQQAFRDSSQSLSVFMSHEKNMVLIERLAKKIVTIFESGGKLLICGNGGSACDSMHFAEEFTGRFRQTRRALPVIALTDVGHLTCVANDFGFDKVFSRGVEAYGKKGDLLIGLSTSGRSQNIICAVEQAKKQGLTTCLLLGKNGGLCKGMADFEWIVPGQSTDRIQELHMLVLHVIIECVERLMFPEQW